MVPLLRATNQARVELEVGLDTAMQRNLLGELAPSLTGLDIIENQIAGDVDAFEVEHEETSPQVMLTARLVF